MLYKQHRLQLYAATGTTKELCLQSNNKTWHSCFQCHYSHVDINACTSLNERDRQLLEQCNQHFGFGALSVSNYAPQLAWWLNFFTPDRFLIISSQELRDEDNRMKVRCEVAVAQFCTWLF